MYEGPNLRSPVSRLVPQAGQTQTEPLGVQRALSSGDRMSVCCVGAAIPTCRTPNTTCHHQPDFRRKVESKLPNKIKQLNLNFILTMNMF